VALALWQAAHFLAVHFADDFLAVILASSKKAPSFGGIPVRVSNFMPKGSGVLIDSAGRPIKFFKLSA